MSVQDDVRLQGDNFTINLGERTDIEIRREAKAFGAMMAAQSALLMRTAAGNFDALTESQGGTIVSAVEGTFQDTLGFLRQFGLTDKQIRTFDRTARKAFIATKPFEAGS